MRTEVHWQGLASEIDYLCSCHDWEDVMYMRCCCACNAVQTQGAKNIAKIEIGTALWASAVAGGASALLGAAIGVPLLLRQLKTWDATM
jgi:hypothetical protein